MVSRRRHRIGMATAASLLLGACATTPHATKPAAPSAAPAAIPATPIVPPTAAASTPEPIVVQPPMLPAPLVSPWDRLRARLVMTSCDYNPAVQRWAKIYTQGPDRFAATLKRAAPFLLMVLDELERQDLPGEFAFLPYLESTYEPIVSRGDTPAGMWQFMPNTARAAGMTITSGYDGRLDAYASTRGAISLLARYQQEFGDWRLVDMAFNAGEFGVKQLLHGQTDLSTEALSKLKLSPVTHEHLAKLLALSCILNEPERFRVELPQIGEDDRLTPVDLETPVDLRVAQRLAEVDGGDFQRWNAGYRGPNMPANSPQRLLLPASARERFLERYAQLTPSQWSDWSVVTLRAPRSVDELADAGGVEANLLGVVNGVESDRAFARGANVLLPSRQAATFGTLKSVPAPVDLSHDAATTLTVRNGDTLWDIATRYKVSVSQLRSWNGLGEKAGLKPGQRLRVAPAD